MNTSKLLRLQNSITLLQESLNFYDKAYLAVVEDEEFPQEFVISAIQGIRNTIRMAEQKFQKLAGEK